MQPITIVDQSIPLLDGSNLPSSGNNSNPVLSGSVAEVPITQVDQAFPVANVAQETISQSLNTETKRILAEYTFESLGAIRIGGFVQGVSGEINISPDGITAKNVNGDTTFTLNGATGDATFKGTVTAGSIISGTITLGGNGDGNGILTIEDSSNNTKAVGDSNGFTVYDSSSFRFYDSSVPGIVGYLGPDGASNVAFQTNGPGIGFKIYSDLTVTKDVSCLTLHVNGSAKTAIVPTSQGYKALYAIESPEVWFMDFIEDPEREPVDSLFLEVTEGEIKSVKCEDGSVIVFRRRKGHAERFENKTKEEFEQNERFLQMARIDN